ncbi:HyuE hydantoin racemase [Oceanicola sp. 22II-s10i]|uniref:aspartate/glutamate racemase family protein n=1 Tax=Oceanicola sp. 22II-s10i TaxID=1317116 RepID=UPI000B521E8E|nr:aspartate/glutamate racemase family protein [Oceanicola sp. 22II-s10i]OWU84997.1 HyuE hydantoin racemase [Oceanicola sp. 22II-s10i]
MRILYINPNSTEAMTDGVVEVARKVAPAGVEVIGWTNAGGPPAIQGPEDGASVVPALVGMLPAAREAGADAIVIACFDDTGLAEMRAAAHCPVFGIGQAGYVMADAMGHRFSVVTSLAVSVPVIENNIATQGFKAACVSVRASGLPVLEIEAGAEPARARLAEEILAAKGDGASVAVLGCAGMSGLKPDLARRTGMVLIDGAVAALWLSIAAVSLGADPEAA